MRSARLPLLLLILAALLAGCGGNQISADEVSVDPPVLTIPTDPDAAPGATAADADQDADSSNQDPDADATATATADPGASSGGAASGGGTSSGGGTTAEPTATATPTPAGNTGGAQADEGLDQFCADNPGAC